MKSKAAAAFAVTAKTDALVLFRTADKRALKEISVPDAALQEAARAAIADGEFGGGAGETLYLRGGRDGRRLLVVGCGESASGDALRQAGATAAQTLDKKGLARATFLMSGEDDDARA
ncbi:MAG: M17 family peptidase N-terminal domain-containing protein, partial [Planctomycetota bacterium]